jgi:Family of unknown function (DUF5677)
MMARPPASHVTRKSLKVLSNIKQLEDYLDGMEMIPAVRLFRNAVILPLLSKALTVGRAICVLVDSGFPAEAFAMSRTLIEIYFCVRYIGNKDTESRAKTYVKYTARVRQEWKTIVLKFYPKTPASSLVLDAGIIKAAQEFKSKAHWTGHGGQAKLMALEEDTFEVDEQGQPAKSEFDYDALYFWTSHFVHATVDGIDGHACEPGEVFKVHAGARAEEGLGENALFNTVVFITKTFIAGFRAMHEEQPDKILRAMFKLMSGFKTTGP